MPDTIDRREVDGWWQCDICRRQFEDGADSVICFIDNYTICEKCYNRGIIFSIREGWKEKCRESNKIDRGFG